MYALMESTVEIRPGISEPRRRQALAICLVAGSIILLDMSIFNVALPSIELGSQ
jgi:hypothetical protein